MSVLLALALAAGPSESATPRVVVTPIEFTGQLPESFRDRIFTNVVEGLQRSQYRVIESTEIGDGDYVVRGSVTFESRNYTVTLEIENEDGKVVARSEEPCELCGIGDVESMVADQAATLSDKLASVIDAQPLLIVKSKPPGATVVLDGKDVGVTPLQLPIEAGPHRTRARLPGYFEQELDVDAVQGMRQAVVFQLVAKPPVVSPSDRRTDRFKPWGFVALGLGIGSLAVGGVLLGIDERPYRRQCSGMDVDEDGNCRLRYDTLAGGIAGVVTGAVLTIAGSALLGLAYRKRKGRKR